MNLAPKAPGSPTQRRWPPPPGLTLPSTRSPLYEAPRGLLGAAREFAGALTVMTAYAGVVYALVYALLAAAGLTPN